jgi:integrase
VTRKPRTGPRRPKGTGRIDQLPSGAWRARITIAGRIYQKTLVGHGARTRVRAWLESKIGERAAIESGTGDVRGTRQGVTVESLADEYLEDLRQIGRTPDTLRGYRRHLAVVLRHWSRVRLRELTGPRLEQIRAEMTAFKWSPSTVRNRLDRLTGMARFAMRMGYIPARVLPVRRPKVTIASRPHPYTDAEVAALVQAAKAAGPRELVAVLLGADAGLRRGEIMRASKADFDPHQRRLHVPMGKTGSRWIPVTRRLARALDRCEPFSTGKYVCRPTWTDPTPLVGWLQDVWAAAGIDGGTRLHRLRHYWATLMVRNGAKLDQLLAWGGWANLSTVRRYLHERDDLDRSPVDRIR